MLPIDVLLTENELAEDFLAALEQRYLAEKFFYWFPLSVKAWLDLCQGQQPYKTYERSYELVARNAADVACRWGQEQVEVVSLGSGQGDKDILVVEALARGDAEVRYRPVDASQALLEMAVRGGIEAGFPVRGLKADVGQARTGELLAATAQEPRLYLVLGNTLGAIDPQGFLRSLRFLLRSRDRLLVDAEVFASGETMKGYDNPVNRRFAFAPLASVGLEEGRDGALLFSSEQDAGRAGLHLVSKHFRAARRLEIPVAGQRLVLEAGEKIAMNGSYKYSEAGFRALVREAGFETLGEYLSTDKHFLLTLVVPAAR